jgi:hypothetical protein
VGARKSTRDDRVDTYVFLWHSAPLILIELQGRRSYDH